MSLLHHVSKISNILNIISPLPQSQLSSHEDIIRTMAVADRCVVSGSGSNDGYAAVWRAVSS